MLYTHHAGSFLSLQEGDPRMCVLTALIPSLSRVRLYDIKNELSRIRHILGPFLAAVTIMNFVSSNTS